MDYLKMARQLKETGEIREAIILADKYLQAEQFYVKARALYSNRKIKAAVDRLIKARELVTGHQKANALFNSLVNTWSGILMLEGKNFIDAKAYASAYQLFEKLNRHNPGFPEATHYFFFSRDALLKERYTGMINSLNAGNLPDTIRSGNEIFAIKPGYIDASEIISHTVMKAFNQFYQRGLHFLETGNYGKAILAFRSAEDQLSESRLTQKNIKKAENLIINETGLKMAFWNFSSKDEKSGVTQYATKQLKKRLAEEEQKTALKTIDLQYDSITDREMSLLSDQEAIDWGLVQSKSCNALVSGTIETLRIDTSKTSQWKTRSHMKKKIVDNEEYLTTVIKLAKLNNARIKKMKSIYIKGKNYKSENYESAIEKIEKELPGISPKIEKYVEEVSTYQVENHTMKANVRINIDLLYQDGTSLWQAKSYADEFIIEDQVVPPDLQSSVEEERAGDPLTLPSEYEFKQMAVNHIIDTKILPDLMEKFNNYGIRFYHSANRLSPIEKPGNKRSEPFQIAVEDYFKFLFTYKDKGEEDLLPETVQSYLDSFISDNWIIDGIR